MKAVERQEDQLKSLEEVKAVYGGEWPGFFNNFSTWFPAITERSGTDLRGWIKHWGLIDRTFLDVYPNKGGTYSEMFLKQSPREFFETVDRITLELSISPEEIRRLKELRLQSDSSDLRIRSFEQLQELIAPIYFRLRQMGYGHLELAM